MTKKLILPLSIQLYLKLSVQHKDKNIMPDNKGHVIPVNGIANSVFKNVEIKMNNIVVSNVNNMYEFRADLENCLGLDIDVQKNPMGIERYFPKENCFDNITANDFKKLVMGGTTTHDKGMDCHVIMSKKSRHFAVMT